MNKPNDTDLREALRRRELKRQAVEVSDDFTERLLQRIGEQDVKCRDGRAWRLAAAICAVAASIVLLVVLTHPSHQGEIAKNKTIVPTSKLPDSQTAKTIVPTPKRPDSKTPKTAKKKTIVPTPKLQNTHTPTKKQENLEYYIARLEAEMNALDDSVNAAHLEQLIAADARLQQLVKRILKDEDTQALRQLQNDSTANYINF